MVRRNLFGIILVVVGLGFLLDSLGVWSFGSLLSVWWPFILILIGVLNILSGSAPVGGSVVLILIGVWFQLQRLDFIPDEYRNAFWPLLIILAGVWIMFGRSSHSFRRNTMVKTEDRIDYVAVFSGVKAKNASEQFQGGSISTVFGGAEIDLRSAALAPEGANMDINVAFGGADIIVPDHWKVIVSGIPLFGGWDNKTKMKNEDDSLQPVLRIKCFVVFGGMEVKNY